MKTALMLSFLAFTCFVGALLWVRTRQQMLSSRIARAELDALDLGLLDGGEEAA